MRSISSSILDDKKQNGIGIIPFVTSGFPNISLSKDIILNLLDEKLCSAVEVGIPFSDPIAEGKTIQKSSSVALKNGVTIDNTLKMISDINESNTALAFLATLNSANKAEGLRLEYKDPLYREVFGANLSQNQIQSINSIYRLLAQS